MAGGEGYPSADLFKGAWFGGEYEGGNHAPPVVPFGRLEGSLAWRLRQKATSTMGESEAGQRYEAALKKLDNISVGSSMLSNSKRQQRLHPRYWRLTTLRDPRPENPGTRSRPGQSQQTSPYLDPSQTQAQAQGDEDDGDDNDDQTAFSEYNDEEDNDEKAQALTEDADYDVLFEAEQQLFPPGHVDIVTFVEELPSAASSQGDVSETHCVDLKKRTVFILPELGKEEMDSLWERLAGSSFRGQVRGNTLIVSWCKDVGHLEAKPDFDVADGEVDLTLTAQDGNRNRCLPQSASPPTSFLLRRYTMTISRSSGGQEESWPIVWDGKIVEDDWESDLSLMGEIASFQRNEPLVFAPTRHPDLEKLQGVGVCMRDGGSRFDLSAGKMALLGPCQLGHLRGGGRGDEGGRGPSAVGGS